MRRKRNTAGVPYSSAGRFGAFAVLVAAIVMLALVAGYSDNWSNVDNGGRGPARRRERAGVRGRASRGYQRPSARAARCPCAPGCDALGVCRGPPRRCPPRPAAAALRRARRRRVTVTVTVVRLCAVSNAGRQPARPPGAPRPEPGGAPGPQPPPDAAEAGALQPQPALLNGAAPVRSRRPPRTSAPRPTGGTTCSPRRCARARPARPGR